MKANVIWLDSPGVINIREEILKDPSPNQLQCKTQYTAISTGSELAHFSNLPELKPRKIIKPRQLVYCNVSKVIKVGKSVSNIKTGDRLLTFAPHRSAFNISYEDILYVLPEKSDSKKISTTYLFHLGYNSVLISNIKLGSRVLILGLGLLGLTSTICCINAGAETTVLTNNPKTSKIALELGARRSFNRNELAEYLNNENNLFDNSVITSNLWDDYRNALKATRQKGKISILGHVGRGQDQIDFNPFDSKYFYSKQLQIEAIGASPENNDSRGFLRFNEKENIKYLTKAINDGIIDPNKIISDIYNYRDIEVAYNNLINRLSSPITYLLDWNDY